jgi:hypothetical protein
MLRGFVIVGPKDLETGERLCWSNDHGWTTRENADVFYDDEEIQDPMEAVGREWIVV